MIYRSSRRAGVVWRGPLIPPTVEADGSITLPLTVSGAATPIIGADGSITLPPTVAGTATPIIGASGSIPLSLVVAGDATPIIGASGGITLPLTIAGAATPIIGASGGITLPLVSTGAATPIVGASGAITLPLVVAGNAGLTVTAEGVLALPLTVSGSAGGLVIATGSITLPLTMTGAASTVVSRDLMQAVYAWYLSQPSLALAGGLWLDVAPEGTPLPYAAVSEVSTLYSHVFGPGYVAQTTFQVNIFAGTDAQARSLGKAWGGPSPGLHRSPLPVTEGSLIVCHRVGRRHFKDPDRGPNGSNIFVCNLEFLAQVDTPET